MSSALSIVLSSVLVLSQIITVSYGSDPVVDVFATRAVNNVAASTFLKSYTMYIRPSDADVAQGFQLYKEKKLENFEARGVEGAANFIGLSTLKELASLWESKELVSTKIKNDMVEILSPDSEDGPFKTILEHVFVKPDNKIVYGITGFLQSAVSEGERIGSVFYAFRQFKLQNDPIVITYERKDADSGSCSLWGQFCFTNFKIQGLTDDESNSLFGYIRAEALKSFAVNQSEVVSYVGNEASRYSSFLPKAWSDALKRIEENPDKSPDQLFDEDPFNVAKFKEN